MLTISSWKHYAALACGAVSAVCVYLAQTDASLAPVCNVVAQVALFIGGAFFATSPNVLGGKS